MTIFEKMEGLGYELMPEHDNIFQKQSVGGVIITMLFNYNTRSVLGCVYPTKLIYSDAEVKFINQGLLDLEKDLRTLEGCGITIERR